VEAKTLVRVAAAGISGRSVRADPDATTAESKLWRVNGGAGAEVYFRPEARAGRLCASDFTHDDRTGDPRSRGRRSTPG